MNKSIAVLLFAVASTNYAVAQETNSFQGKVFDAETNEGLGGVNVVVKGTVWGTITDEKGVFQIKVNNKLPIMLGFSFIGYKTQEIQIQSPSDAIEIKLVPGSILTEEVVITASRVEESIMKSPVAIEKLDLRAIKATAASNFFDAMESVKGLQMTTLSMGFKVPNSRGFMNTTNPRFLQMVDGADTQAPGLGVSIANTVGPTELDIESIEITPGASSALYGLNALNGISNFITKSPFTHTGLSVYQKFGVNHINDNEYGVQPYSETAIRYAKSFNNRFAFKINAGFMKGTDWVANNYTDLNPNGNSSTGLFGNDNPAQDPVNSYGNESGYRRTLKLGDGKSYQVVRTGYAEKYLVNKNYEVKNPKLDASLFYKINQNMELSYTYRVGLSTAVYQRGNRVRLDDYQIEHHKVELKGTNYFFRTYLTAENTTKSYNLGPAGAAMDKAFKDDNTWFNDYTKQYNADISSGISAAENHHLARAYADDGRFTPGTAAFDSKLKELSTVNNWDLGDQLILQNKLVHAEGQYDFTNKIKVVDVLVGGDARDIIIKPDGNSFINPNKDDPFGIMHYTKAGGFVQVSKKFLDNNLKVSASVRVDKAKYFDPKVNPRIAAVYTLNENHNFRFSVQNGYRFPTIFEGFSAVNNGGIIRYGGIDILTKDQRLFENSYVRTTVDAFQKAILNDINNNGKTKNQAILDNQGLLVQNTYTYLKPEEITAFDIGYKGSLDNNRLFVDADVYYNIYNNFIDQIEISKPKTGQVGEISSSGIDSTIFQMNDKTQYTTYRMWTNAKSAYYNYGASLGASYNFYRKYSIAGNVSYAKLDKISRKDNGLETPFNTPNFITNLSLSNREIVKNVGFNISWHWQNSFDWKSQLANGTVAAYHTVDAQVTYKVPSAFSTIKIGGTNIFNTRYYQYVGGPTLGSFYYVAVTLDGLLK